MTTTWGDDSGACPPLTAQALASGMPVAVAAAIRQERLLVPVVKAPAGSLPVDDADACGTGDAMASVTFVAADGRRALLAFSSLAALLAWDPGARPLPQAGADIAASAVAGGMDALIIDIASDHRVALQGAELQLAAARGVSG
jgi:hypothetical protein